MTTIVYGFWIEEENKWMYTDNPSVAQEIRNYYVTRGEGYTEYFYNVIDGKIVSTNYDNSIIGTEFKGELINEFKLQPTIVCIEDRNKEFAPFYFRHVADLSLVRNERENIAIEITTIIPRFDNSGLGQSVVVYTVYYANPVIYIDELIRLTGLDKDKVLAMADYMKEQFFYNLVIK